MRRFLYFPILFAVWFVAAYFGITALSFMLFWLRYQLIPLNTDIYFPSVRFLLGYFLRPTVIGILVDTLFAALDFALYRGRRHTNETFLQLTQNMLKSGAVAVILVLLCQVISFFLQTTFQHRRYHSYPPDMQMLNVLYSAQLLLLFVSVLWAMGKTLRYKPASASAD